MGIEPLDIGASDVVIVEGATGYEVMAVTPGDSQCQRARHPMISIPHWVTYLETLESLDAMDPIPPSVLEYLVTPVPNGGRAHRITRTRDRQWAAWITNHDDPVPSIPGGGGRVGIIRANDHHYRIFNAEDFAPLLIPADWPNPQDIALIEHEAGVRAYFVYEESNQPLRDDFNDACQATGRICSAMRFLYWDGDESYLSGERTLPHTAVRRLALTPDKRSAFITYSSGILTRWDLGDGNFNLFQWDTEIVLPHLGNWGALYILDQQDRF